MIASMIMFEAMIFIDLICVSVFMLLKICCNIVNVLMFFIIQITWIIFNFGDNLDKLSPDLNCFWITCALYHLNV